MAFGVKERIKEGEKKPTRFYSSLQEKKVAKETNGRRVANSGATMFEKGDVNTDKFLIECKTRTSHCDSISFKKEWILKNSQEALFMGKPYSSVCFSFGPNEPNYYVIDEYLFKELLNHLSEQEMKNEVK